MLARDAPAPRADPGTALVSPPRNEAGHEQAHPHAHSQIHPNAHPHPQHAPPSAFPAATTAPSSRAPTAGNSASLPLPALETRPAPARQSSVPLGYAHDAHPPPQSPSRRQLPPGAAYAAEVQHALDAQGPIPPPSQQQRRPMLLPDPPVRSPIEFDEHDPTLSASSSSRQRERDPQRVNYSRPLAPSPVPPALHTRRSFVGPTPSPSASPSAPAPVLRAPAPSTRTAAASGLSLSTQLPAFVPAPAFSPEDRGPYPPLSSPTRGPGEGPASGAEYLLGGADGAGRPGSLAFDAAAAPNMQEDMAGVGTRSSLVLPSPGAAASATAAAPARSPQLVPQSPYAVASGSAAALVSAPGVYPREPAPQQQPPPPHLVPQPEVCVECMMRDRDMADVDVTGAGVWERESDAEWEEQCRWEAELAGDGGSAEMGSSESGMGGGVGRRRSAYDREGSYCGRSSSAHYAPALGGGRRFGRGQLLTSGNLKVWTTMNPPAAAHRWRTLQTFLATQAHFLELDRQARLRERERELAPSPVAAPVDHARNRSSSLLSPAALAAEKAALEYEERVALRATRSRSRATLADETNRHSNASLFPPPSLAGSIGTAGAPHPPFAASSGSSMRSYSAGDQPWLGTTLRRLSSPSGGTGGGAAPSLISTSPPKSPATSLASARFAFPKFARSTTDLRSLPGGGAGAGAGATPRSVSPARTSGDGRRTSMWSRFRQSASASVLSFAPSGSMMDMHLGLSQDKHQMHGLGRTGGAAQYGTYHGGYGQPLYDTYAAMSDPAVARHADRRERDRVIADAAAKEAAAVAGEGEAAAAGGKKKKKGLKGFLNKLVGGGRRDRPPSNSAPATPGLDGDVAFDASLGGDDDELAPPPPLSALANEPRYHQRSASNSSVDSFGPYTPPLPPAQQFRASYAMPMPTATAADRQSILTMGSFTSTRSKPVGGGGGGGAGGRAPTVASRNSYGRPSLDSLRDQASFQRPGSVVGGPGDGGEPEILVAGDEGDLDLPQPDFAPQPHQQPRSQKSLPLLPSEAAKRPTSFDPHVAGSYGSFDALPPNLPYANYGASRSAYSLAATASPGAVSQASFGGEFGFGPAGESRNATVTGAGGEHPTVRKRRSRAKVFSMHFGGFGKAAKKGAGGESAGSAGSSPEVPALPSPGAQAAMRGASLDSPSMMRYGAYEARQPAEGFVSLR
ncbi:hypothetical protein JCM10449v2_006635 [Rhodotorula kratochvilovae]